MFFRCFQSDSEHPAGRMIRLLPVLALAMTLSCLFIVSGCGGGSGTDKADVVLAQVGDKDITAAYYEAKLVKLEQKELPRSDTGQLLDMSGLEGKQEFLQTLINKEVMAKKAVQLGYDSDPQIAGIKETMLSNSASAAMWNAEIGEPTAVVTPEELEAFYARMGELRECSFVITNFKEDAEAAREMARSGADWADVAAKYHAGEVPPGGNYELTIPYGRYNTDFDTDVFFTPVGDVSPPILTVYGYWVLKVNAIKEVEKPGLEEAKGQILDVFRNRNLGIKRKEFRERMQEKYKSFINEDVLWLCYKALPDGEMLIDPVTDKPTPRSELNPLNIRPEDAGKVFFGHLIDGQMREYTLGEYKTNFDQMSVFERPKANEMLGNLRQKIADAMVQNIMLQEAKARGFYEDPEVLAPVNDKVEEMMVTKLYDDVVTFDEVVTPEQMQEYWDAHSVDFLIPETRNGHLVICRNEEAALQAREAIEAGMLWKDVLVEYGIDKENKARSGKLLKVVRNEKSPVVEALFALAKGETSQPIAVENGRFALIRQVAANPSYQPTFSEKTDAVKQRILSMRGEEAFQALLGKWALEFGVVRFEDQLAKVASWQELTEKAAAGETASAN